MAEEQIRQLSEKFPHNSIPKELDEILKVTKGWDGFGPEMVYFDSIDVFGFTDLFPNSISLGTDGFGNYWVLDISPEGDLGKVFFVCHDPAVIVVNSQNLNEHLKHLLDFYKSPTESKLISIDNELTYNIWQNENNLISKTDFIKQNSELELFVNKFEREEWTIADLRESKNRDGFPWGKQGSNQILERHPTELIWVMKNKKRGFFSKLFSRDNKNGIN